MIGLSGQAMSVDLMYRFPFPVMIPVVSVSLVRNDQFVRTDDSGCADSWVHFSSQHQGSSCLKRSGGRCLPPVVGVRYGRAPAQRGR